MNRIFVTCLSLVMVLVTGCAVTDYAIITDNDQVYNHRQGRIVNTNGQALITPKATVVAIYSDGNDELFSMIDQKANGTSTITTYNYSTTGDWANLQLLDYWYCNPDWNGCSIFTAPDNNDDRLFDGRVNENCSGARSLSVLLSTDRYYGECGRARLTMEERLQLLNEGAIYEGSFPGLLYDINRDNSAVRLQSEGGSVFNVPVFGNLATVITMKNGGHVIVDAQNSMLSNSVDAVESIVATHGAGAYSVYLEHMGVEVDLSIAFTSAEDIARFGRLHY